MNSIEVHLMPGVRDAIAGHLCSVYPQEGCGALVGKAAGNTVQIVSAAALANTETGRAGDRFTVDALEYARLERELAARNDGSAVVGFFHSHPDSAALPSSIDLERAIGLYEFTQTQYVYAIQSIINGRAGELRFWILDASAKVFNEL